MRRLTTRSSTSLLAAFGRLVAFAIGASFFFLSVTLFWPGSSDESPDGCSCHWANMPCLPTGYTFSLDSAAIYNADFWGLDDQSPASQHASAGRHGGTGVGSGQARGQQSEALPARVQSLLDAPAGSPRERAGTVIASAMLAIVAIWEHQL